MVKSGTTQRTDENGNENVEDTLETFNNSHITHCQIKSNQYRSFVLNTENDSVFTYGRDKYRRKMLYARVKIYLNMYNNFINSNLL